MTKPGGYPYRTYVSQGYTRLAPARLTRTIAVPAPIKPRSMHYHKSKPKPKVASATALTRRRLNHNVKVNDGPVSDSFYRFYHSLPKTKIPKGMKRVTGRQYYYNNFVARLDVAQGTQQQLSGAQETQYALWSEDDLTNIMSQASKLGLTSTTFVQNTQTQKILLRRCTYKMMITNQSNDVAHVTMYFCQPRRDIDNAAFNTPKLAWFTGTSQIAGLTSITGGSASVGATPFVMPSFTELYKVQKVISVDIHSGGHHVLKGSSSPNYVFSNEVLTEMNTSGVFRNLTSFIMIVCHGYPANDGATNTNIGTAPVSIDTMISKQYEFDIYERSSVTVSGVNNQIAMANPKITNDLTAATGVAVTAT